MQYPWQGPQPEPAWCASHMSLLDSGVSSAHDQEEEKETRGRGRVEPGGGGFGVEGRIGEQLEV